jgi:uncharacterized membrane protein YuzA (DUF378 family)
MLAALALAAIGAINWGLVGFFNWNLINAIFGGASRGDYGVISRLIYCAVGLAGVGLAMFLPRFAERGDKLGTRDFASSFRRRETHV